MQPWFVDEEGELRVQYRPLKCGAAPCSQAELGCQDVVGSRWLTKTEGTVDTANEGEMGGLTRMTRMTRMTRRRKRRKRMDGE